MKTKIQALVVTLLLWPLLVGAIDENEILDFGDAFKISARVVDAHTLEVSWEIVPQHYLYNNRFLKFSADLDGVKLGPAQIPEGERGFDPLLGQDVEKYHDRLTVTLPLEQRPEAAFSLPLTVRSQGCRENVLCYPPTAQQVNLAVPALNQSLGAQNADALISDLLGGPAQTSLGAAADSALPAEQAFVYEAIALEPDELLVRFTAQPGYYLYRDKFTFSLPQATGIEIVGVDLPAGRIKDDPEFGPVPVYYDQVEIPLKLSRMAGPAQALSLRAGFQGCQDGQICYPPMQRDVELLLPEAASNMLQELPSLSGALSTGAEGVSGTASGLADSDAPIAEQDKLARLLQNKPLLAMLLFFVAGLGLAFTPCVFPMIPILSGIIAGQGENISTSKAFTLSLVYVLAMALTYTAAGVIAGLFGQNLQAMFQNPWIISAFVAIFVLLALSMFGFYELQLPASWQSKLADASNKQGGGNLFGVAAMGLLSALIVGPCVAAPLAAALIVIGQTGSPLLGGGALFSMALGMGVPLLIFGVSAGALLPRAGAWMNIIKALFGIGLLGLAVWFLDRIIPGQITLWLFGVLGLGSGFYLFNAVNTTGISAGVRSLWHTAAALLILFGTVELLGAAAGGDYWLRPLQAFTQGGGGEPAHLRFKRIKSSADLDLALAEASAKGQATMFDFYADWCVECIRMERTTFVEPSVVQALAGVQLLQADVTANDEVDQALMERFDIIGPPAILFFDSRGQEISAYRLVGYKKAEPFVKHVRAALR